MSLTIDCKRCGKTFANKYSLKQHLEKENICRALSPVHDIARTLIIDELFHTPKTVQIIVHACKWCDKVFKQKSYLHIHENKCAFNDEHDAGIDIPACTKQIETENETRAKTIDMNTFQAVVMKKLEEVTDMLKTHNHTTITNNVNFNTTININSLGKESLDHITMETLSNYIKNIQLIDMIKYVNFNPNIPENHNVKRIIQSKNYYKNMFLKYYDSGKWTHSTKDVVLRRVKNKAKRIMLPHFEKMVRAGELTEVEIHNISECLFKPSKNSEIQLMKEIFACTLDDCFVDDTYIPIVA